MKNSFFRVLASVALAGMTLVPAAAFASSPSNRDRTPEVHDRTPRVHLRVAHTRR